MQQLYLWTNVVCPSQWLVALELLPRLHFREESILKLHGSHEADLRGNCKLVQAYTRLVPMHSTSLACLVQASHSFLENPETHTLRLLAAPYCGNASNYGSGTVYFTHDERQHTTRVRQQA